MLFKFLFELTLEENRHQRQNRKYSQPDRRRPSERTVPGRELVQHFTGLDGEEGRRRHPEKRAQGEGHQRHAHDRCG